MKFVKCLAWLPDDMPESTEAVVVISDCGSVIKRLPYRKWSEANLDYVFMREHIYKVSENRGKQAKESPERIAKFGKYQNVCIRDKWYQVHRLVAIAFIPNPLNKPYVNHKNGRRDDNRVKNLEWVTNAENNKHSWDTGIRCVSRMRKIPAEEMGKIISLRESGKTLKEIGEIYGVTSETIRYRIKQNEKNTSNP